jgi:hypothetical protein
LINKSLREMQSLRMRDRKRTCAKMPRKQAPQVSAGHTESVSESFDVAAVERAVGYQAQAAPHGCRRPFPGGRARCAFGPTPKAGTKTRLSGCGRSWVETDVLAFWRTRRTYRSAVDPGGLNSDEKPPIEPGIARNPCLFEYGGI